MKSFLRSNAMWGAVIPAAVALAQMPGRRHEGLVQAQPAAPAALQAAPGKAHDALPSSLSLPPVSDAGAPAAAPAAGPARAHGAGAGTKRAIEYRYQAGNKPDPFLPMAFEQPQMSAVGLTKLQQFEVKDYHLVGTLVGSELSALLLTPDKSEGLIARVGERMGLRGGRIISIGREKMVVRETRPRGMQDDGPRSEDVTLELRDPDAGANAMKSLMEGRENASVLEALQGGGSELPLAATPQATSSPNFANAPLPTDTPQTSLAAPLPNAPTPGVGGNVPGGILR